MVCEEGKGFLIVLAVECVARFTFVIAVAML